MKGINDLFQQAQGLQEKMANMQEELQRKEVTGESGAGLVKVTLNGQHEAKSVSIDEDVFTEDRQVLEDLIAAAITDASRRLAASQAEAMKNLTGGMSLPPGFKFPFQ
ncbi:MAG: YbaB/EbfC family nucleoid-associated protein [Pseudomonadaceae bacterium]|nr:YbaB/EbfC family nucleoid-associated protein [Pseudomonadaceae bacterium]